MALTLITGHAQPHGPSVAAGSLRHVVLVHTLEEEHNLGLGEQEV